MQHFIIPIIIGLSVVDVIISAMRVKNGARELNPLLSWLWAKLGYVGGSAIASLLFSTSLVLLYLHPLRVIGVGFLIVYGLHVSAWARTLEPGDEMFRDFADRIGGLWR